MIIRINFFTIFLIFCSIKGHALEQKTLKVAQIPYPPYFTEEFDGILNLKIKKILKPYKLKWVNIPLPRVIDHLNSGSIDINTSFLKLESRLGLLDFSIKPIFSLPPTFCVHKSKKSAIAKDLKYLLLKKHLLLPKGIYLKDEILKMNAKVKVSEIEYESQYATRALNMLEKQRIDIAFFPEGKSHSLQAKKQNIICKQMLPDKYLHFSFKKGNPLKLIIDKLMTNN